MKEDNKTRKQHRDLLEQKVRERTDELQTTNDQLRQEIAVRKRAEERMTRSNNDLLTPWHGFDENVMRLTALCGELLGATCAIYNRLEGGLLSSIGQWQTPPDYVAKDKPDGHICFDVIKQGGSEVLVVRNLSLTPYAATDPNVTKYGLETYLGRVVRCAGEPVGSLCVVFQENVEPTDSDKHILCIIASFIACQEDHKQIKAKIQALNIELEDRLKELLETKALEEEAKRAKGEFMANISHELTTPLNSIIGFCQVLLTKNFGEINEKQQGYLENILHSGERLHETLKNIISFVLIDVSNPDIDWADLRLKDIITSSLSAFWKAVTDRHLTLTLDMEKEADRLIRADRAKLIQVFHNLLSNAVKFSRDGGQITLSVRNLKGSEESGKDDFMEITVKDTGIGIKAEEMPRLFQHFQQLEAPLTKEFAGVGMGLVLARKIIEAHGGTIRVESDYGKGSRFIFTIPVFGGQKN